MALPRRKRWPEVEAALSGRVRVTAAQVLALIHQVNPTGQGLSPSLEAERYRMKSRLQSMLVLRFPGELEITADPSRPGVISIRHRYLPQDGCHAVIADLDEEARSWATMQLDLAARR